MDGAYPKKVANTLKVPLEQAQQIFDNYHNTLYPDITTMRNNVLKIAKEKGYVPLGFGCVLNTDSPEAEIRTDFNACSQFWSILTLLTINKMHYLIDEEKLQDDVEIVSTIYDSIYLHITAQPEIIKWVNDTIIPIMVTPYLEDIIVPNEAEGEVGFNWYDTVKISNGASIEEITKALITAKEIFNEDK